MLKQLTEEERLIAEGKPGSATLRSNHVRASEARYGVAGVGGSERTYVDGKLHEMRLLSVNEIPGNTFVFNFAGDNTTAISLAYSVLILVAHPEVQEWLGEELDFCFETDKNGRRGDLSNQFDLGTLLTPENGTFIAWSKDARDCAGKNFAQVEVVAGMATLSQRYRAEPVSKAGKALAAGRKRVLDMVKESNVEYLLQMGDLICVLVGFPR